MITKFLLVLSWIFMFISASVLLLKWVSYIYYNSKMNAHERLLDKIQGKNWTFPVKFWPYVLIFTVTYLITYYYL